MHVGKEWRINGGWCMDWAYIAYHLYKGVELWTNDQHAFVRQGTKFYDSESPNGIRKWEDLNCNRMSLENGYIEESEKVVPSKFKRYWSRVHEGTIDWDRLDRRIQVFMKSRI